MTTAVPVQHAIFGAAVAAAALLLATTLGHSKIQPNTATVRDGGAEALTPTLDATVTENPVASVNVNGTVITQPGTTTVNTPEGPATVTVTKAGPTDDQLSGNSSSLNVSVTTSNSGGNGHSTTTVSGSQSTHVSSFSSQQIHTTGGSAHVEITH